MPRPVMACAMLRFVGGQHCCHSLNCTHTAQDNRAYILLMKRQVLPSRFKITSQTFQENIQVLSQFEENYKICNYKHKLNLVTIYIHISIHILDIFR